VWFKIIEWLRLKQSNGIGCARGGGNLKVFCEIYKLWVHYGLMQLTLV
jgi:hypothetical protein